MPSSASAAFNVLSKRSVYFEFDSFVVEDKYKAMIESHAKYLAGNKAAKVTLNLHSIPLGDVLKYVTESAGLRYRVDPHAIVIYKPLPIAPK